MKTEPPAELTLAEFLESVPPNQGVHVPDVAQVIGPGKFDTLLATPQLQMHCNTDDCNGVRFFRADDSAVLRRGDRNLSFVEYVCANCRKGYKLFALAIVLDEKGLGGNCYKLGEFPVYGPPTPARLIKLIGPDRELFLAGRRCENQGLGIGALTYYRRVVVNQMNRILAEIVRVARKLNVPPNAIAALEGAQQETQFSRANGLGEVCDPRRFAHQRPQSNHASSLGVEGCMSERMKSAFPGLTTSESYWPNCPTDSLKRSKMKLS